MKKESDVVYISGTGSGKTLTFWIPMLYEADSITILVTTLNVLGAQTAGLLSKAGIPAVNMTRENANHSTFQDIKLLKYRLIVVSPELLVQDPRFDRLWDTVQFTSRLARFIFDEGHCISQWGASFRPEFASLYKLRFLIPKTITFYIVSATLPKCILDDIRDKLHLKHNTTIIRHSNDRWNCSLIVRRMQRAINSYQDLNFLFRSGSSSIRQSFTKFLIFFNNRKEAEEAAEYIWKTFGRHLKDRLVWFHSIMSDRFRSTTLESFKESGTENGIFALMCTDAAGMGLDISDITMIVQWKVPDSLCTLMQRFGRAARDLNLTGTCILLAEPRYFVQEEEANSDSVAQSSILATGGTPIQLLIDSPGAPPAKKAKTLKMVVKSPIEQTVEAGMNQFINAKRENPACRRAVSNKYFDNDKLTPEDKCCTRCQAHMPIVCCDLCDPTLLNIFDTDGNIESPPVPEAFDQDFSIQTPCPKVRQDNTKAYLPRSQDTLLKRELYEWRDKIYDKLGRSVDGYGFGSSVIMTDSVIQRLVDLAHYEKIKKIEDLTGQIKWPDDFQLASEVLEIIKRIHPPIDFSSLFTKTPRIQSNHALATGSPNLDSPLRRKSIKCSACGQSGHNARNQICPKKLPIPTIRAFGLDITNHGS